MMMVARSGAPVSLARGRYSVWTLPEPVNVDLLFQEVRIAGRVYAWVDGIDYLNPIFVPIEEIDDVVPLGPLGQYLRDERHLELGDRFDELLDLGISRDLSATLLARACEFLHGDETRTPADAIDAATQWGAVLQEMTWGGKACRDFEAAHH